MAPVAARRPQARSLRAGLALVVASVSLPSLAFLALVLWQYTSTEQSRLQDKAISLSRASAVAIDRELAGLIAAAQVLSLSPHLQTGNLEAFHERTQELRQRLNVTAVLVNRTGQQLLAADAPFGSAAPNTSSSLPHHRVLETGKPLVSDLIVGQVSPAAPSGVLAVAVPVTKDGQVTHVLGLQVPAERIRQVILSEQPPTDWVVAVIDRAGLILARNRGQERFAGRPATPDLLANTTGAQGTWWGYTQEGTPVFGAYSRTKSSDWRVAVGVARAVLNAPLYRSLLILAGVGLALTVLSILLTYRFGRHITGALNQLVSSATAVGAGEIVSPSSTSIREVNQIGARLAEASLAIHERHLADERAAAAGRRIQTIFESITDSVFVVDREWRFTYLNKRASDQVSGGQSLIGQNIWEVFPEAVGGPLWGAYHEAMDTGRSTYAEQWYEPFGVWFAASAYPSAEGLTVYFRDVTAEKRAQEQQALMVRELHHRVRNTLATVQAIANATARSAEDIESFRQSFSDRIVSLSRTHTLLVEHAWGTIPIRDLLEAELAPWTGGDESKVELQGPSLELPSDVALAFGMAIHELTTNAAKYGSLSVPEGRVEVSWVVEGTGTRAFLNLAWIEKCGPPVALPQRAGFGSQLLDKILTRQLGAEIDRTFAREGIQVRIRAPLGGAASDKETAHPLPTASAD